MNIGCQCELDLARIHHNQRGALEFCPVHPMRDERMRLCRIGSDHQNARCILDFGNRVCHGSTSECGGKTCHRRSVSETGAGIYVVGSKTCPAKLLEKVVLFIGAPGRGGEGEAVTTVFISDFLEPGDGEVQGLIPGNLLKGPVLANKGRCQPRPGCVRTREHSSL